MRPALPFAQGPLELVLSRLKPRERHRPRLCAVRGIEATVRPSTFTADLLTAATSVLGRIVLRSARIAPKRPPGAIANADLRLLLPLRRRLRPSVTELLNLFLSSTAAGTWNHGPPLVILANLFHSL